MADGYQVRTTWPSRRRSARPSRPGAERRPSSGSRRPRRRRSQRQDLHVHGLGEPGRQRARIEPDGRGRGRLVRASQRYARDQRITTTVASWPFAGCVDPARLAVSAVAGAPLRIVSQRSLVNLRGPARRRATRRARCSGPDRGRADHGAGDPNRRRRRRDQARHDRRAAAPGHRRRGDGAVPSTRTRRRPRSSRCPSAGTLATRPARRTSGRPTTSRPSPRDRRRGLAGGGGARTRARSGCHASSPAMSPSVIDSVAELRNKGRVYTELLTDQDQAIRRFDQTVSQAATSLWRDEAVTRVVVNDAAARQAGRRTNRVSASPGRRSWRCPARPADSRSPSPTGCPDAVTVQRRGPRGQPGGPGRPDRRALARTRAAPRHRGHRADQRLWAHDRADPAHDDEPTARSDAPGTSTSGPPRSGWPSGS